MGDDWDFLDSLDFGTDDAPDLSPLGYDDGEGLELIDQDFNPRIYRAQAKRSMKNYDRRENLKSFLKEPPKRGETVHLIVKENCSMWDFAPVFNEWLGTIKEFYGATWRLSKEAANEYIKMVDDGKIKKGFWLLDKYFKRLEPATLYKIEQKTKGIGWVKIRRTHIKLMLLNCAPEWITITGSMNMARESKLIESIQITNDETLFNWNRGFFNEL